MATLTTALMRAVLALAGVGLAAGAGYAVYAATMPDALVKDGATLAAVAALQVAAGALAALALGTWRSIIIGPAAYLAGFAAAGTLALGMGDGAALAALAGGSPALGLVYLLAMLCCLFAVGAGIGSPLGLRLRMRLARRRARRPAARGARRHASDTPIAPPARELAAAR